MAEINYNKEVLDTFSKIEQLKNLATTYGLANTKAAEMADMEKAARDYEKKTGANTGIRYTEADYKTAEKDMLSQIESQFATLTTISYNDGSDYQKALTDAQNNASKTNTPF